MCGFGRMGKIVCDELERLGHPFVAVDTAAPAADWGYRHGVRLHGNSAEDDIQRKAEIEHAWALITAVGSGAKNLDITLSARVLNPSLVLVVRAEAKLRRVEVTHVVSPYFVRWPPRRPSGVPAGGSADSGDGRPEGGRSATCGRARSGSRPGAGWPGRPWGRPGWPRTSR